MLLLRHGSSKSMSSMIPLLPLPHLVGEYRFLLVVFHFFVLQKSVNSSAVTAARNPHWTIYTKNEHLQRAPWDGWHGVKRKPGSLIMCTRCDKLIDKSSLPVRQQTTVTARQYSWLEVELLRKLLLLLLRLLRSLTARTQLQSSSTLFESFSAALPKELTCNLTFTSHTIA